MNSTVKKTVEGGLLAAVTVILCLGAIYLPVVGVFIEFFCSVPIAILVVRQGEKIGLAAAFVSLALLFIFVGPIMAVRVTLMFSMCGVIFGACLRRGLTATKSFLPLLIMSFLAQIISVVMISVVLGVNFADENAKAITQSFEQSFALYKSMGVDPAELGYTEETIGQTVEMIVALTPLILFLVALLNAIGTYVVTRIIFRKLHMKFPAPMLPFSQWRFSIFFVYLAAFAGIGLYWGETREISLLYFVSLNGLLFALLIGLIQGFSLITFLMNRYKLSKILRGLIVIVLVVNFFLLQVVAMVGLFDVLFDYRKSLWKN